MWISDPLSLSPLLPTLGDPRSKMQLEEFVMTPKVLKMLHRNSVIPVRSMSVPSHTTAFSIWTCLCGSSIRNVSIEYQVSNDQATYAFLWITDAAAAMYLYDWALTLDMEINLVWLKKWNTIKAIYLFQRYAVIVDACILAIYRKWHTSVDIRLYSSSNSRANGKRYDRYQVQSSEGDRCRWVNHNTGRACMLIITPSFNGPGNSNFWKWVTPN